MTKMTECCIFLTAQKLQISIHLNNKVVSVKKKELYSMHTFYTSIG